MIKIGGGTFKGRSIKIPKTTLTRVSTSYSKKVIFDTIFLYIEDAIVLDLFAGSGSLGIEAISRGAKEAFFVDSKLKPIAILKENITYLDIESRCKIIKQDSLKFIKNWNKNVFDIIFLDPPYSLSLKELKLIIHTIEEKHLLTKTGVICLEIPTKKSKEIQKNIPPNFCIFKEKKKGETTLIFIRY